MPLANFISLTEPFGPPSPLAPLSDTTTTRVFSNCSALPRTDPWPGPTHRVFTRRVGILANVDRQVTTCLLWRVGDVFRALADPTRRAILDELTERDGQTLFELCTRLTMKHGLARPARRSRSTSTSSSGRAGRAGARAATSSTTSTRRRCRRSSSAGRPTRGGQTMRINLTSVLVDDQDEGAGFYTEVLGFVKKRLPLGEYRGSPSSRPTSPTARAAARARRAPGRQAVQGGAGRGRHPVHVVRRRRRPGRARAAAAARRRASPRSRPRWAGDHRRVRRHLRQPDPDHQLPDDTPAGRAGSPQ